MTAGTFEAGFAADARPSCGTCGAVYDPAAGDPGREVPPGTPFGGLPDYWRCPGCGGPQHGFAVAAPPGGAPVAARVAALTASYRLIAERDMAGVPICNAALAVEAVGFRSHGSGWIGCVIAPWFLNAVLIPRDPALWADRRDGDKMEIALPSGAYRFTAARVGVLGTLAVIPLVSAMNVFADQEDARAAAVLAFDHLMREPQQPAPQTEPPPARAADAAKPALSRRSLFGRARG
ncbi:[NiFe] hydrogenase assembly HybE family chaperone [Azospirillum brasilense]|uniref:[NiFe] hydrogenase assembly HybE family chaperone n=1 Tax=Azospirillum brasilense TaxID=192 RepID=A0A560BQ17_AZOBR|nr:[NiFe]-hydrogenase assembly chaperone HybE [Azospirillum brasilense]TWA74686.1 [NiFe] hydrogenase assembly HybE family chaperone [Azospirillum brasilense]